MLTTLEATTTHCISESLRADLSARRGARVKVMDMFTTDEIVTLIALLDEQFRQTGSDYPT